MPPSAVDRCAERAAARPAADPSAGRTPARRRRSAPGRRPAAASGGRKRITVPARPQSTVPSPVNRGRGSDLPLVAVLGDLHAERPQAVPHQPGVARVQAVADHRRPAGQRGQDQGAVGLRTWSRERAPWRGSAPGRAARPRAGVERRRACDRGVSSPRARCSWPACRPCGPPWPAPLPPSPLPWRARRQLLSSLARTAAASAPPWPARPPGPWPAGPLGGQLLRGLELLRRVLLGLLGRLQRALRLLGLLGRRLLGLGELLGGLLAGLARGWRRRCRPGPRRWPAPSRRGRCRRRSALSAFLASLSEALLVLLAIAWPPFWARQASSACPRCPARRAARRRAG